VSKGNRGNKKIDTWAMFFCICWYIWKEIIIFEFLTQFYFSDTTQNSFGLSLKSLKRRRTGKRTLFAYL
jgi:hypothetical protein